MNTNLKLSRRFRLGYLLLLHWLPLGRRRNNLAGTVSAARGRTHRRAMTRFYADYDTQAAALRAIAARAPQDGRRSRIGRAEGAALACPLAMRLTAEQHRQASMTPWLRVCSVKQANPEQT